MIRTLQIEEFLALAPDIPVADVRTPAEFDQGHIPQAHNLPIFTNEERVEVGTTYKKIGREAAILLGFEFTGPKWSGFIKEALRIAPHKKIALHCWRGGMRSGAMAWALNLYGFEVYVLESGYKSYRQWALSQSSQTFNILILGGMTGSGKTQILHQIRDTGEQMIDLEDLAQHQGSSYGSMGTLVQPSQEQFENNLAYKLCKIDKNKTLWLEDESRTIGKCSIPNPLWDQMRIAPLIKLNIPLEERIRFLTQEYGKLNPDFLIESTQRIGKRLGPEQTRDAILAIEENRMADFIRLVLVYYDKTYKNGQNMRELHSIYEVAGTLATDITNVKPILEKANTIK